MDPIVIELNFDLDDDYYKRIISDLRETLAHHPQQESYEGRHLLPKQQRPKQPARWIYINFVVQDGDTSEAKRTTIAIRDDNVYLMAFKNGNGDWYEFGIEGKSMGFIADSIFIGCDISYPSLVGGADNLMDFNLSKKAMTYAVKKLSAYQHVGPADRATRRDLARLCVMICETARMNPHYKTVKGGWNKEDGSTINRQQVGYITTWGQMSRGLVKCAVENLQGVRTHEAYDVVYLLLNSPEIIDEKGTQQHNKEQSPTAGGGRSSQQRRDGSSSSRGALPGHGASSSSSGGTQRHGSRAGGGGSSGRGRPLVEIFGVEADYRVVSSIDIYDGKRGQIIYRHDHEAQRTLTTPPGYNLDDFALAGPYKTISAERSFAIQVDGILPGDDDDEPSKVSADMFWDCYADDIVYNEVVTRDIDTDRGRLATVTYAVLTHAVEAVMGVSLLLHAITHVHGEVSVHCAALESERLVLFRREVDAKLELVPSSPGSMVHLELGRSVIAVPVLTRYSRVWVSVELHTVTPNNDDDFPLAGTVYFYFDKHTGEIRINQLGDIFVPVGWTEGSEPLGTEVQQPKVQLNMTSPDFHVSPLEPENMMHMLTAL